MKCLKCGGLLMAGLMLLLTWNPVQTLAEENRPVEILTFAYSPYMEEDGTGILPRMIREAGGGKLPQPVFRVYPRKRALQMFLKEGQGDLLFLGESRYFPELAGQVAAIPLLKARMVMAYRRAAFPDFSASDLEDFKGYRIASSLGSHFSGIFREKGMVVEESKMDNNLRKLMAGRVDFWHTVDITALEMIARQFPGRDAGFGFWEHRPYFVIELLARRGGEGMAFLGKFEEAFQAFKARGGDLAILEDYYGKGRVPEDVRIP